MQLLNEIRGLLFLKLLRNENIFILNMILFFKNTTGVTACKVSVFQMKWASREEFWGCLVTEWTGCIKQRFSLWFQLSGRLMESLACPNWSLVFLRTWESGIKVWALFLPFYPLWLQFFNLFFFFLPFLPSVWKLQIEGLFFFNVKCIY